VKANLLITIIAALVLSGCGLFLSGPSAAIKQMMADSEKGDIDAMVKAWSKKAIEEQGVDSVRKEGKTQEIRVTK